MKSLAMTGLRYVLRFVVVMGVCVLVGGGIGPLLGSGWLGVIAGAVIGLCVTLVVPGPAMADDAQRSRHTATVRGHDAGGSGGGAF